jgi:cell division protein FtsQ
MSADLADIQRAVETLPWVDHARIARRWPNSLRVTVIEQTAAARWGESGLLNTRGELFVRTATHVPAELPHLSGPEGSQSQVAKRYLSAQGRMLEAGMRIAALRLDERGAWEMDLDSGVTVRLGRRDVDERFERFIHTASQVIAHRLTEISYVDMRYSNGFAIGWRNQGPASGPAKRPDDTDA